MKSLPRAWAHHARARRSPCGERGLKCDGLRGSVGTKSRRSPCGERGLKSARGRGCHPNGESLPVRGAWIEMFSSRQSWTASRRSPCGERGLKLSAVAQKEVAIRRRSPCGERGLKCSGGTLPRQSADRRSPCGERGLKSRRRGECPARERSLPVRGAWIEIASLNCPKRREFVAPRAGSVD